MNPIIRAYVAITLFQPLSRFHAWPMIMTISFFMAQSHAHDCISKPLSVGLPTRSSSSHHGDKLWRVWCCRCFLSGFWREIQSHFCQVLWMRPLSWLSLQKIWRTRLNHLNDPSFCNVVSSLQQILQWTFCCCGALIPRIWSFWPVVTLCNLMNILDARNLTKPRGMSNSPNVWFYQPQLCTSVFNRCARWTAGASVGWRSTHGKWTFERPLAGESH